MAYLPMYPQHALTPKYQSFVQREKELSNRMIEKFQREMDHLIKHEENMRQKRLQNEQKLEQIFNRDIQIDNSIKMRNDKIKSIIHEREQELIRVKKQNEESFQDYLQKAKQQAKLELSKVEAIQQEKEFQQKLLRIQQKMKHEEFKIRTDELINNINQQLQVKSDQYLAQSSQKDQYIDNFFSQRRESLQLQSQSNTNHLHQVRQNYQAQLQHVQDVLKYKMERYNYKIANLENMRYSMIQDLNFKSQNNSERINKVQMANDAIKRQQMQKYQGRLGYLRQKWDQIEMQKLANWQQQKQQDFERNIHRQDVRAKSENFYRNKSLNLLNKLKSKDEASMVVLSQKQNYENSRIDEHNRCWQEKQRQIQEAEEAKLRYLDNLNQRIISKDHRLSQQILEKNKIQQHRLKLIDNLQKRKRDLLTKIEQEKLPIYSTNDMLDITRQQNSTLSRHSLNFFPTQI